MNHSGFFQIQIRHLGQKILNKRFTMPRTCMMSLMLTCRTRSRTIAIGKPCGHSIAVVQPSQKRWDLIYSKTLQQKKTVMSMMYGSNWWVSLRRLVLSMLRRVTTNVNGVKWSMPVAHDNAQTPFRKSWGCVVRLGLTYLGICDTRTTTDVEWNLKALNPFEAGSKIDHYRIEILNAAMQVWMEAPRVLGQLVETVLVTNKNAVDKIWRPKIFIQDAMSWYMHEQFYGKRNIKCRQVPVPRPDEVAVKSRVRRLPALDEQKPKLVSKRRKVTRSGVDHAWNEAISQAATKSSDGTLLSPRLPRGTKRPPLEKKVISNLTKKIIKKLAAKIIIQPWWVQERWSSQQLRPPTQATTSRPPSTQVSKIQRARTQEVWRSKV